MNLLETLSITAIFSTAFVLIIRKLIEQFFSKDLEKFKSELQKELIKHRTKFEILHAERANVIKEVYRKIVKTQRAFESLIKPLQLAGEPTEEEKTKILADEFNSLASYYRENRLFFNEALAQEIDKLLQKFIEIWNQWEYTKDLQQIGQPNVNEWSKAWDKVKDEIPPIQKAIENRFRDTIGID